MRLNQKGYMYPLTFSILLLFSFLLTVNLELLLAENKVYKQTKTILKQEYYMLCSVKKMESLMVQNEPLATTGYIEFTDGRVLYLMESLSDTVVKINFTLTLTTGEQFFGFAHYDKTLQKMVRWIEKN